MGPCQCRMLLYHNLSLYVLYLTYINVSQFLRQLEGFMPQLPPRSPALLYRFVWLFDGWHVDGKANQTHCS